jgi:Chaperone for flagella basal body P-ring formation
LWLLWTLIPAAFGQASNPRFPISSEQVAAAIVAAGVPVSTVQVRFLSQVSALGQDSGVEVMNMAKWSHDIWKVELRCQDRRACLPFYVLVDAGHSPAFDLISALGNRGRTARRDLFGIPRPQILMRNGDRATLLFENPSVRITIPVICLQNGNLGQTIRVESTDRKQFFQAEIVKSGLLKVSL